MIEPSEDAGGAAPLVARGARSLGWPLHHQAGSLPAWWCTSIRSMGGFCKMIGALAWLVTSLICMIVPGVPLVILLKRRGLLP